MKDDKPSIQNVPSGCVLIGDTAYNLDYANNLDNQEEMRSAVANNSSKILYVKGFDGIWTNNFTSKTVEESSITIKMYKDKDGKITEYKI